MSRPPLHALIWSKEQRFYELYTQGQLAQRFQPAEEAGWLVWLQEVSSFAFHGARGSLNVYQEQRPRGGAYWYAYQTKKGRTRKRYLGQTESLRFSRLEETAHLLLQAEQPATPPEQEMVLLSSRLAPPRPPNALVMRERLLTALDQALLTPLTLLSASAGWGKTTLLSVWAHRQKQKQTQVAWFSPDELDNSPTRFWIALIAALRRCPSLAANFGENVTAQLQSPQPPSLSSCLSVLLHELESRQVYPAPLALIVDDYQVIEESVINQGMAFFLENLPAHVHLILSTRVDPDLPLARLRAHGQLTEIRADELRFQEGEAQQFFAKMLTPPLSEEELQRLVSRTEGWIAGLHLVALTIQKREDRATYLQTLTGSQRYLLDYVQEDILARLAPDTRTFLLHISILSRLDAAVCQAVTAAPSRATSQHMLTLLERANLFLVPLDEERRTYRLHDLFREALLSALHSSQPEMVALLHRRAADFYEAEEQWHEAITHALAAADFSTAARLMEQTVEQFWVHGEAATLAQWVLALPDPLVREHVNLVLTAALYLLHPVTYSTREQRENRHQQVRRLIERVEAALQHQATETNREILARRAGPAFHSETSEALLYRRLRLLRTGMILYDVIEASEYERLPSLHQQMQELDQDEEVIWHMLPLFCNVVYYTIRQERAKLLSQLLDAREQVRRSGSHFAATRVIQWLVLSAEEAGQLRLAYQESLAALDQLEQTASYALLKGYFKDVLAMVLYQWNRLEEARVRLRAVIQDAATWQQSDLLQSGYIRLMQIELARGDLFSVQHILQEFEQLEGHQGYYRRNWLPIIRAQWWLAQGQTKEAANWAVGVAFPQGAWERSLYDAFPVVMRVYFAQLRWTEALEQLERFSEVLGHSTNRRIALTYLAQYMVALHHTGQNAQVYEVAARLFALTEPEGYLRVYLDEGEPMRQVLEALLNLHFQDHELASSTRAHISRLLAVFEQGQQGPSIATPLLAPAPPSALPASVSPSAPGDFLTQREQEVLRLLATGASNQEIARTLVIELPTVKKHVSNLLGKLGATSRTQAVAVARARSLL